MKYIPSLVALCVSVSVIMTLAILQSNYQEKTDTQFTEMASSTVALKKQLDNANNAIQLIFQTPEINAVISKEYQSILNTEKKQ